MTAQGRLPRKINADARRLGFACFQGSSEKLCFPASGVLQRGLRLPLNGLKEFSFLPAH